MRNIVVEIFTYAPESLPHATIRPEAVWNLVEYVSRRCARAGMDQDAVHKRMIEWAESQQAAELAYADAGPPDGRSYASQAGPISIAPQRSWPS